MIPYHSVHIYRTLIICSFSFFILLTVTDASLVQMRVVKEIANYGYFGNGFSEVDNVNHLVASVPPANFSGPVLLHRLLGKCYNFTEDRYRYVFCPFQNFTQYEVSNRWNAYQGILGIWSHWEISNNTFTAMVHTHGDSCGETSRVVKIFLECGAKELLLNVSEPARCQYSANFQTRYVCHRDAMLVYPRLPSPLQKEWDRLETQLYQGIITQKGYQKGLEEVLQTGGFLEPYELPKKTATSTVSVVDTPFVDLLSCNKEYKNLQREISRLHTELEAVKVILDLQKIYNRTHKPQR